MGCVLPANLGQAPARQAALHAGLPVATGCTTVNKVCGSGMKAIMFGHDLIKAGSAAVVVAGGMESMTNAPHMVNARTGIRYGDGQLVDHMAWDGLTNPYDGKAMGVFGELCADKYHFTREEQDAFAIESVKRAQGCASIGCFRWRDRAGHRVRPQRRRAGRYRRAAGPFRHRQDPFAQACFPQGKRHDHRRQFVEHFRWRGSGRALVSR